MAQRDAHLTEDKEVADLILAGSGNIFLVEIDYEIFS